MVQRDNAPSCGGIMFCFLTTFCYTYCMLIGTMSEDKEWNGSWEVRIKYTPFSDR